MKITETIERECCAPGKDLVEYKGLRTDSAKKNPFMRCKHCGQIWEWVKFSDAAGNMDERLEKVSLP